MTDTPTLSMEELDAFAAEWQWGPASIGYKVLAAARKGIEAQEAIRRAGYARVENGLLVKDLTRKAPPDAPQEDKNND